MLKKYLLPGCLIAALTACGGGQDLDNGPTNDSIPDSPPPVPEYVPQWRFSDASDLDDWTIEWNKPGSGNAEDSEIEWHESQFALEIHPHWGGESVAKNDNITVYGTLPEPMDISYGTIYLSLYYTHEHLGNPWGTDPYWGQSAHHMGTQYLLIDADGNRALLDTGNGGNWMNSFDIGNPEVNSFLRTDLDARGNQNAEGFETDEVGYWFDLAIKVGDENGFEPTEHYWPNGDNAGEFDVTRVVSFGVVMQYALEFPTRNTDTAFSDAKAYWDRFDGASERYIYIDEVAMVPGEPPPPVPNEPPNAQVESPEFGLPIFREGLESGFNDAWPVDGATIDFASDYGARSGELAIEAVFDAAGSIVRIGAPEETLDLSTVTTLDFDVWAVDEEGDAKLWISLCDCEDGIEITATQGEWTTVSIPVADFGKDFLYGALRIKNNSSGSRTVYIDDFGFDRVSEECSDALHPVVDQDMVFFDWNGKDSWWGAAATENDPSLSVDGTAYGRVNLDITDTAWTDLFWRNGDSLGNAGDIVGSNISEWSLKFDINVLAPISGPGIVKIRFRDEDGVDSFYDWNPWTASGEPFTTDGWETIEIPLSSMSAPDYSLIDQEFGMAWQEGAAVLNFAIDNVRFEKPGKHGLHPVKNPDWVFFDWDGKDSWWGNVATENDASISLDGSAYGRANFQTGGTGWTDLFWRNGDSLGAPGAFVADNVDDYALKFDINVFSPISGPGGFKIRFRDEDGVDSFYDWNPWVASGEPFTTDGWTTIVIPLSEMSAPDYSLIDQEFGMAWQDGDILLDFAIDNVRFEKAEFSCPGVPDPVVDESLVFFDWNGKDSWWGNVATETDEEISSDGTSYGRANFQTGGTGWTDLFWRNGDSLGVAGSTVGTNINNYSLKFDIYTIAPISGVGAFKIRFHDGDGVDSFYEWAPWRDSGYAYNTYGWTTVTIPLSEMSAPDYSLIDQEFGVAWEYEDVLLNFAIDNVRFEAN